MVLKVVLVVLEVVLEVLEVVLDVLHLLQAAEGRRKGPEKTVFSSFCRFLFVFQVQDPYRKIEHIEAVILHQVPCL